MIPVATSHTLKLGLRWSIRFLRVIADRAPLTCISSRNHDYIFALRLQHLVQLSPARRKGTEVPPGLLLDILTRSLDRTLGRGCHVLDLQSLHIHRRRFRSDLLACMVTGILPSISDTPIPLAYLLLRPVSSIRSFLLTIQLALVSVLLYLQALGIRQTDFLPFAVLRHVGHLSAVAVNTYGYSVVAQLW